MKKVILFAGIILSMASCETQQQKDTAKKLEELKCKADFSMFLLENGTNIEVLLRRQGFDKEVDAFYELREDSLVSCDSIQNAWRNLSAKTLR